MNGSTLASINDVMLSVRVGNDRLSFILFFFFFILF